MADYHHSVQIEKIPLPWNGLDGFICSTFCEYEKQDLQFGLNWLTNLALTALENSETAVIFVARLAPDNFIALPLKLNSHNGHASSLSTFYSSAYSPIAASFTPDILFYALFQHLVHKEKIATITLSPLDVDAPLFGIIHEALVRSDMQGVHNFFCFGNWIHDLAGASYQSYMATRSSRLRNTIARRTRQFADAERGKLTMVTGGSLLEEAIDQFVSIYNRSWKREEPYPEFIPQLLRLSASRGWLRLGVAHYNDEPVASQIWLVWQHTAYIYKLAYDENYKQLSPGSVLTAFMMEYAIETDGVTRIDYLSGDDAYKKDWMSTRRERHGIAAYNVRTLRGGGMLLGRAIKNFIKALPGKQK